jgi:hypothetical protein
MCSSPSHGHSWMLRELSQIIHQSRGNERQKRIGITRRL